MANRNGLLRMKIDFENAPLMDAKRTIHNEEDFDDLVSGLKLKLFGR